VEVARGVIRIRDSCNVYLLVSGPDAVAIDIGTGAAFDRLGELGLDRITDVLVTHHHRDGVQGLARAAAAGARIWVPPVEQDLVARVDEFWRARRVTDDYELRQDRFSLLEPVAITGTVDEYRTRTYGAISAFALPTPGHTMGSVTYLVEHEDQRIAFTGDLLYAPGRVWSLAATQWTYTGVEGQAATILSCGTLCHRAPELLLPAHGEPMDDPAGALAETQSALGEVLALRRGEPWDVARWLDDPWEELSPHLLRNRTSLATSYALLSDSGAALLIDWGFDLWPGTPLGGDRWTNRPLLESAQALRRDRGVTRIEAAVTTHYHDDHVAGLNLLRDVEGTEVWAPANVAPVLEQPRRYDLPCLWIDPIAVDRTLELEATIRWHEYALTVYPLPGHTLYAAAIGFEADGRRVLATGDQQGPGDVGDRDILNYQYRNRFRVDDYVASAELYRRVRPDLILGGHWAPREVDDAYLDALLADGRRLVEVHRLLLPEDVSFGPEGFGARIEPYTATVAAGGELVFDVLVRNPFPAQATATVRLELPAGWGCEPSEHELPLPARGESEVRFVVPVGDSPVRRARVAADLTVDGRPFGQQAEALVDVT
jgi:glyoxylase-like metal-dependent hydrolase (beta-lactamase superfamily II)